MQKKQKRAEWKGYALAHLTEEMKSVVKANKAKPADILSWIEKKATDGYKFAVSWDADNQCYQASLFAMFVGMPNEGLMLSLRHVDMDVAIASLMLLHDEVYEESWHTRPTFDW